MHNIFHYLLCSFGDCYTCFTLTRRVFSLLWWSGKVSSFFWTEHKRLVPSFHSSQGTQIICSTTALPWIPVNEQPGIVVGQSPRAWWCGGTRSMAPPSSETLQFWEESIAGHRGCRSAYGDTLALLQHVHKAQGVLLFMGRWGTSKSNKTTWKITQHT